MGPTASRTATDLHKTAHDKIKQLAEYFTEKTSEKSLHFLFQIGIKNPSALDKLLIKLKRNTSQLKTQITAAHVDTVIELLYKQMALPANIFESIDAYIESQADELNVSGANFIPHRYESSEATPLVLKRAVHIIDKLNLLNKNNRQNEFLKKMIRAIIEFNDKEQKNGDNQVITQVEIATKASRWLSSSMAVSESSNIKKIADFLTARIITLGYTTIKSPVRTMGLSELFFIFEELAIQADLPIAHDSNLPLISEINAVMLSLSICVEQPTAFYDIVTLQQHDVETETLPILRRYYQAPLLIEQFFSSNQFHRYFGNRDSLDAINQEAFFMTLAPCLLMQNRGQEDHQPIAKSDFIHFIQVCRKQRTVILDSQKFMDWFEQACIAINIEDLLKLFFFETIEQKISVCLSQVGSLVFVANKLISMGFSPRSTTAAATGLFQPLISPDIPMTTTKNLKAINVFYNNLEQSLQKKMLNELVLMAIVIQSDSPSLKPVRSTKHQASPKPRTTPALTIKKAINSKTKLSKQNKHRKERFFPTLSIKTKEKPMEKGSVLCTKDTLKTQVTITDSSR